MSKGMEELILADIEHLREEIARLKTRASNDHWQTFGLSRQRTSSPQTFSRADCSRRALAAAERKMRDLRVKLYEISHKPA